METEPLMLSGIQHFAFCKRQWALIHIEQQWQENVRTVDGKAFHHKAHNGNIQELRGDILTLRGLSVFSERLGISGVCDVVEFHRSADGVSLLNQEGKWIPYPVEYKKGEPKANNADRLQLCAQAVCLEEMLVIRITEGALFYGETRRREQVVFSDELRDELTETVRLMHHYYDRRVTPPAQLTKACNACSLLDVCIPHIVRANSVADYIQKRVEGLEA